MSNYPKTLMLLAAAALIASACASDSPLPVAEEPLPVAEETEPAAEDMYTPSDQPPVPSSVSDSSQPVVEEPLPVAEEIGLIGFDECAELLDHIRDTAAPRVGRKGLDGLYQRYDPTDDRPYARYSNPPGDFANRDRLYPPDGLGISRLANSHTTSETDTSPKPHQQPPRQHSPHSSHTTSEIETYPKLIEGIHHSNTNVAVQGVDEPYFVKTDGRRIFLVTGTELTVVDAFTRQVTGSVPMAERARLGFGLDIFIKDNSVLLLRGGGAGTIIQRFVLENNVPKVSETLQINRGYVSSRSVDGVVSVVLRRYTENHHFPFSYASSDSSTENLALATEANLAVVQSSTLQDWLPSYVLTTADSTTELGLLPDCKDVYAPAKFAGFGTTSVLALPIDSAIGQKVEVTSLLAPAEHVHRSPRSLYMSTWPWPDKDNFEAWSEIGYGYSATWDAWSNLQVNIHRFDMTDPDEIAYSASGLLPGALSYRELWVYGDARYIRRFPEEFGRSPFSISEHDGNLRVVTLTSEPYEQSTEGQIRVLSETDGRLVEVGLVDDIGKGNMVQAVRFDGDVGYIVTSRPEFDHSGSFFYTISLSDPTNPEIIGRLPFIGFAKTRSSSFLYPVGDGLILAVGVTPSDAKVSLFNVKDFAEPREVAVWTAPGSSWTYSPDDYHAFQWWAPEGIAVIPFRAGGELGGVVILKVDENRIRELGRINHRAIDNLSEFHAPIRNSVIIADNLWTISDPDKHLGDGRRADSVRLDVHDLVTLKLIDSMKYIDPHGYIDQDGYFHYYE